MGEEMKLVVKVVVGGVRVYGGVYRLRETRREKEDEGEALSCFCRNRAFCQTLPETIVEVDEKEGGDGEGGAEVIFLSMMEDAASNDRERWEGGWFLVGQRRGENEGDEEEGKGWWSERRKEKRGSGDGDVQRR
ncbi:hypothetical protein HAX54_039752 [Datura stramonium]|uniref:Uncharacterized protein n=1 Tax=Datura stramonium TaxID=4076 RepID=A0ABS8VMF1_DATST|nr:hypothetical protein [Datura stramonium]